MHAYAYVCKGEGDREVLTFHEKANNSFQIPRSRFQPLDPVTWGEQYEIWAKKASQVVCPKRRKARRCLCQRPWRCPCGALWAPQQGHSTAERGQNLTLICWWNTLERHCGPYSSLLSRCKFGATSLLSNNYLGSSAIRITEFPLIFK